MGAGEQAVGARRRHERGEARLGGEVDPRGPPAEVVVHDAGPRRAVELVAGLAEQPHRVALRAEAVADRARDVVEDARARPTTGVGRIAALPVWL